MIFALMDELIPLVRILRTGEKRMLNHMLKRGRTAEGNLRLRLFKLIDQGHADPATIKQALIENGSNSSFAHLKRRLRDDILSVLLVKESSKRIAQANRAAQFECIKKHAQAHVMMFRGAKTEGLRVLRKAMQTADRFELLAEKVQMNHLIRESIASRASGAELQALNKQIAADLVKYQAILYAEEQSVLLANPELYRGLRGKQNESRYMTLIEELKALYEKHDLARIGFWYYMAATEFYISQQDFGRVLELGLEFLALVEASPAVRSKNNIAGVNQTVGLAELELHRFTDAIQHFSVSERFFPAAGFNRLQCLRFLLVAQLAANQLEDAEQTIAKAFSHDKINVREHVEGQWRYSQACVEFLNNEIDASFKTLARSGDASKNKDDWNIQFRIFEMLLLVELKDEDWLQFKIDTTRKFLTRYKDLDTPRVRTAVDVLSNLLRKGLDFGAISEKNKEALDLCLANEPGYAWRATGAEFVRFDLWYMRKLNQQKEAE